MFIKYPSIENHYQQGYVNYMVEKHGEDLLQAKYVLLEKIDGANFQIFIDDNGIKFGKRSSFLGENASFYNWQSAITPKVQELLDDAVRISKSANTSIRFFGELFGQGINGRIGYSTAKKILFYDVVLGDAFFPWLAVKNLFKNYEELLVPEICSGLSLEKALEFDVESVETKCSDGTHQHPNKFIEGVIIRPETTIFLDKNNTPFYLKRKSSKFSDAKPDKKISGLTLNFHEVNNIWREYLNQNRLIDLCSKYGEIVEAKQIGEYIKLMIEDAKIDFLKDHTAEFETLSEDEKKTLWAKSGVHIVKLLKEKLSS